MQLSEIHLRDPFVLPVAEEGLYYLYGTTDKTAWSGPGVGFDAYRSRDLVEWEGPFAAFRRPEGFWGESNFWAPEVFRYGGRFYMFATFFAEGRYRGTQVLAADAALGPFVPWSDGPVTPAHWQCLDGTLHVDGQGEAWIVFCHEWTQIRNGSICALRLTRDLRRAVGRPVFLFNATDAPWVCALAQSGDADAAAGAAVAHEFPAYVTDGPFLHRTAEGALLMLWSSYNEAGYAMGIAHASAGTVDGPWVQEAEPICAGGGGHGMIFRAFDGRLFLTFHTPNITPHERAVFREVDESGRQK